MRTLCMFALGCWDYKRADTNGHILGLQLGRCPTSWQTEANPFEISRDCTDMEPCDIEHARKNTMFFPEDVPAGDILLLVPQNAEGGPSRNKKRLIGMRSPDGFSAKACPATSNSHLCVLGFMTNWTKPSFPVPVSPQAHPNTCCCKYMIQYCVIWINMIYKSDNVLSKRQWSLWHSEGW